MKFINVKAECPNPECFSRTNPHNREVNRKVLEGTPAIRCLHCKTTIPIQEEDK